MIENMVFIIKKAGIFLLVGQTLLHLCAGEVYEKYAKMLLVFITVILFVVPVVQWIQGDELQTFEEYRMEFEKRMFDNEVDFEKIRDEKWSEFLNEAIGWE